LAVVGLEMNNLFFGALVVTLAGVIMGHCRVNDAGKEGAMMGRC